MNLNTQNSEGGKIRLELNEVEREEMHTFLSSCMKDPAISEKSDVLIQHPLFEIFLDYAIHYVDSSGSFQIPGKIYFDDKWIDRVRQEFYGHSSHPVQVLNDLLDRTREMQNRLTSKLVRYYQQDMQRLIAALNGLNRFIDINTYLVKEGILIEQQKIIDKQQAEIRQLNTEFEEFGYVVSHDLQQPLTTLISINTLLEDEFPTLFEGDAGFYIRYIGEAAERMSSMINDLLNFSRIGRWSEEQQVDLNTIAEHVIDKLKPATKKTNATIRTTKLPRLKVRPVEIQVLFEHLLGNALKFRCEDQPPVISISSKKNDTHWLFSVSDNGIGIKQKNHDAIFVMFRKLHTQEKYAGNGAGLAYCKKIVTLHGGRIWIESQPGTGSTIYFTLPAKN